MFRSIKTKILISQLGLLIAIAVTLGVTTYITMFRNMKKSQQHHLKDTAEQLSENLSMLITFKKQLLEKIAMSDAVENYFKKRNQNLLIEYFNKFTSQFPTLSYINEDGSEEFKFVDSQVSEEYFNIKDSIIFEDTVWHTNQSLNSYRDPYPVPNGPYIYFSYCNKNYFDEFVGLILARIPIVDLTQKIREYRFGQTGFAVLLDHDETVLSCKDKSKLLKNATVEGAKAQQIISEIKSMKSGLGRATILGIDSHIAYAPIQGLNWSIVTILPHKEFMKEPNSLGITTVLLTLSVLIIGIIVSLVIAGNISAPLYKLANAAKLVAQGDFSQRVNIVSNDELGRLGNSFNHMTGQLEKTTTSIDNIHDANKQLQASQLQLETAYEKLANTNQQLQEFIYVASHNLREPLRKVTAFGDMLKKDLTGQLNHDAQENFDFMIEGAQRMRQLVDSLLSYSKVLNKDIKFEEVNLNKIIKELTTLELSTELKETSGSFYISETLLSVKGDPVQIHLLIHHILENALKYHKKDTPPVVTIRTYNHEKDMIRMEIEDNGVGIKKEQHKNVFSLFKRMHTQEQYEGTGVGLTICKRIVEKHHGHIGIESKYGQGSKFWFTLPASQNLKEIESEPETVSSLEI